MKTISRRIGTVNQDTRKGPSFSLANRSGRLAWGFVNLIFFRFSPRILFGWRTFLLKCFGANVGRGVHIYPQAKIWAPWNLEIGDQSCIADGAIIYNQDTIAIGKNVVVSQGTHLCTGTHDFEAPGFPLVTQPITLEDEVWIAAGVFVHPGVTVSKGCVVGAQSVVVKDLPEWTVCSGFPAAPLRERKRPD